MKGPRKRAKGKGDTSKRGECSARTGAVEEEGKGDREDEPGGVAEEEVNPLRNNSSKPFPSLFRPSFFSIPGSPASYRTIEKRERESILLQIVPFQNCSILKPARTIR